MGKKPYKDETEYWLNQIESNLEFTPDTGTCQYCGSNVTKQQIKNHLTKIVHGLRKILNKFGGELVEKKEDNNGSN